jgi:creatinine amidohydrolase
MNGKKQDGQYLYGFKPPKTLFEMTWEEVQEALAETDIVILPIGSTEQHGPHMPLGADSFQVREMVRRTVVKLGEMGVKAVAGPLVPFGLSSYHMPFPGTISLRPTTFQALLLDVCQCLHHHGFRRFVLPLGHGGNYAAMQVVAQQLVDELPGVQVLVPNWLPVAFRQYTVEKLLTAKKKQGHGGEGETSKLLAVHPELVEMGRARSYYSDYAEKVESDDHPTHGGQIFIPTRSMRDVSPIGCVGEPSLAKAETGEKAWEGICSWLAEVIRREFG